MSKTPYEISYTELPQQGDYTKNMQEYIAGGAKSSYLAYVHSYGCQGNVADGEKMQGILAEMGYGFCAEPEQADLILLNTCAVREGAQERVYGNVGALKHLKRRNPDLLIGLCGCMMQQKEVVERLRVSFPHVDLVFGTNALHRLPQMLYECVSTRGRVLDYREADTTLIEDIPIRRQGGIKAWLPIMYGCDNFCSYCIVPYVRGRERSRSPHRILQEAGEIVAEGYKEITLLGQNVNSYGRGLPEDESMDFSELLRQINAIEGDFRIRFMTSHPKDCTKKLIDTMAECEKVSPYLHLPIQSGSDRILQEMNRGYTAQHYTELASYARQRIPNLTLSSDIIVGFPGENAEDFAQTMEFLERIKFLSLFTFMYSPRSGTKAAEMDDPTPPEDKTRWFRQMLKLQEGITYDIHSDMVGRTYRVLVDADKGEGEQPGKHKLTGRTDTNVLVQFEGTPALVGQFVQVRITEAFNRAVQGMVVI